MTARNADLETLHRQLVATVNALSKRIETANTVDEMRAILVETMEVNHRVTIVGQLLFKAKTEAITDAVAKVTAFKGELDKAIADAEEIVALLKAVTRFLALVDKAIDTAKLVF